MTDTAHNDWNPWDAAVLADQRRAHDEMRGRCPVAHSESMNWSLFRHEDVVDVLNDPRTFSNASRHAAIPNGMDPPEHTKYRDILEPCFSPKRMSEFEPVCRKIAGSLLHPLLMREHVDIVSHFAGVFPLHTCCAFLGWKPEMWERLRDWNHGSQEVALSRDRAAGKARADELAGYVAQELALRRENASSGSVDLTSQLMATRIDGNLLSDEDIVNLLRNWIAGHGTVSAGISILMQHLATNQNLQNELRAEPAGLPATIDEVLRVDGPLVANRRTTTQDVEIGGRAIPKGERVSLMWIAANRDGDAFDQAEEVVPERNQTGNLLFGAGIHDCMGAPLARLEMRVALEEILKRTATIRLSDNDQGERDVFPSNGYRRLPVSLG